MTESILQPLKGAFDAKALIAAQRQYFNSKATLSYAFRIEQLKKLRKLITDNERAILDALHADLRKSDFEGYGTEVGFCLGEIDHTIKHLKSWMRPKRVGTPLFHAIGSSHLYSDPYGVTLIISPWNYPFQLLIAPLIGAICAGNTAVLKPSELAPNTSKLTSELISKTFDSNYIAVVLGAIEESKALLDERFDYIFFTGGVEIGRYVYQVAPDYLLVDSKIKEKLLAKMKIHLKEFFGDDPQLSPDYGRIINERHFDRINRLIDSNKVFVGGKSDKADLYISPTILENVSIEDAVMGQEIFGPVLPVITYNNINEAIDFVNKNEKPLAFYIFTESKTFSDKVLNETSGGGGCINDTLMHLGNANLPFGGVGESGIGAYHGASTFDTFSHKKSVHKKSTITDLKVRYAPYKNNLPILKK